MGVVDVVDMAVGVVDMEAAVEVAVEEVAEA